MAKSATIESVDDIIRLEKCDACGCNVLVKKYHIEGMSIDFTGAREELQESILKDFGKLQFYLCWKCYFFLVSYDN